jgi:hypothetical protein
MGKIVTTAAAIVVLTASWVCAGSFQGLADAASVRPVAPLHIQPGTVTKVEFKSSMKTHADLELESDIPVAEPVAASSGPNVRPRPAVAYRERPAAAMAPAPPANAEASPRVGAVAEQRDDSSELDMDDLGKELVIPPPAPKTQEVTPSGSKPAAEKKPVEQKTGVSGVSVEKRKPASQVKKPIPQEQVQFATKSGKPIRKVHTSSQDQWNVPAGSRDSRYTSPATARDNHAVRTRSARVPARNVRDSRYQPYQAAMPESEYMTSEPRRAITPPPMAERFVRDGVTIKLAPAAAAGGTPYPDEYRDDSTGSDILSAATEIIGLPFAFISSLF